MRIQSSFRDGVLVPSLVSPLRAILVVLFMGLTVADAAPSIERAEPQWTSAEHAAPRSLSTMSAALAAGKPLVIMFSTPGCPYCHALRTEHLNALDAEQARLRVFYIEFDLSDRRAFDRPQGLDVPPLLKDVVSPRDLARRLGVRFAPTVVFLGPTGEVSERLTGYGARDFYAAYLDQRIEEARRRVRAP